MTTATTPLFDWARWNGQKERKSTTGKSGRPPIEERWRAFVQQNPHVLAEAHRLACERKLRGDKRIGVKALWEELRGELEVASPGKYSLNNDFTAMLARELVQMNPSLAPLIELRERRTRLDKAIDQTAPIKDDMATTTEPAKPLLVEHYFTPNLRMFIYKDDVGAKGAIQQLVPLRPGICVDIVKATGDSVRMTMLELQEQWTAIGNTLVDLINDTDPDLGR